MPRQPRLAAEFQSSGEEDSDGENFQPLTVPSLDPEVVSDDDASNNGITAEGSVDEIIPKKGVVSGNDIDAEGSDDVEVGHIQHNDVDHLDSLTVTDQIKSLVWF